MEIGVGGPICRKEVPEGILVGFSSLVVAVASWVLFVVSSSEIPFKDGAGDVPAVLTDLLESTEERGVDEDWERSNE